MDGADYRELPVNGGVDDLITLWKLRKKTAARAAPAARPAPSSASPRSATAAPTSNGREAGRAVRSSSIVNRT